MDQNDKRDINMKNNTLFGFTFYSESKATLIDQISDGYIKKDRSNKTPLATIFTPNPEQIMLAQANPEFASALHDATVLIPDGAGLILSSRLLSVFGKGQLLSHRVTGIDLFQSIVECFPETPMAVIGGQNGNDPTVESTITVCGTSLPWLAGYKNVAEPTENEEAAVHRFLQQVRPQVLFIAFGAPHQELWTLRHKAFLESCGVRLALVVGGAVDVFAGKLKRAPKVLQLLGLEWLFRLFQGPWRWKRQLNLLKFLRYTVQTLVS
jgi:N-acetylglucosaminyldiphosphoundecaprenol N-acetyl-beta-D-mannosaminyltransferase